MVLQPEENSNSDADNEDDEVESNRVTADDGFDALEQAWA